MSRNCHKCQCPLTLVKGEKRRICARCGGGMGKTAYNKQYREEHRSALVEKDRKRYLADRELRIEKAKAYYAANKETVLRKRKERLARKKAADAGLAQDVLGVADGGAHQRSSVLPVLL